MNNKEAIKWLKEVQSHIDLEAGGYTQEMYDAIDLAIKVLEKYESLLASESIFRKLTFINTKLSDIQTMMLLQNSRVMFLCDKEKCKEIPGFKGCNECKHTNCIEHAKNFKETITGLYVEQEANEDG